MENEVTGASRPPIDLSRAGPGKFRRTRSKAVEFLWMCVEAFLVDNPLQVSSVLRVGVLRLFGARVGRGTIIRNIHVKFPWNLTIGERCWIGERVWIHNQDQVVIGDDTVVSQETFITTGSHDYARTMDLLTEPVRIGDGVWLTTRCIVQMGVEVGNNAIVTPGSVVHRSLPGGGVYGGNPAVFLRDRWRESGADHSGSGD